jgi:hypothetical protein
MLFLYYSVLFCVIQAVEAQNAAIQLQQDRMQIIEDLRLRINALDKVFTWNSDYQRSSHQIHRVAGALMSFQECLQISQPLDEPLAALKVRHKSPNTRFFGCLDIGSPSFVCNDQKPVN